ncbi:MAG: DNA methyltransferase [Armatimonadota bacterium]|jgi:ParB-like chromosome segregation protein Spo0J
MAEIVEFPVDAISVGERARALDESAVDSLAASIEEVGLLHAITLTEGGHLIAGLHRLKAVIRLGWETIPARILDGKPEEFELVEIDENLIRAELTMLERAEHLLRRREIYETLHPESVHGKGPGRGRTGPQEDRAPGFARATASRMGQSAATVRRHMRIAEGLSLEVRNLIRRTPVADSWKELRKLAGLPDEEQRLVAERIAASEVPTVWEAQKLVRLAEAEAKAEVSGHTRVFQCPVTDLHQHVEAESCDLILTDPPYGENAIASYGELAEFARHALTPTGSLLVMTGQCHLPQVIQQLSDLTYQWTLAYIVDSGGSPIAPTMQRRVNSWWKPILWFTRDGYDGPVHGDVIRSGPKAKDSHSWQQDAEGMEFLIRSFSQVGELVCDPFLGTGTTGEAAMKLGREFVGADVDEDAVTLARARLSRA